MQAADAGTWAAGSQGGTRGADRRPPIPLLSMPRGRAGAAGKYVCDVFPLDRLANNKRPRRALPRPEPVPRRTGKSPLDLITDEYHALLRALGDEDSDTPDDLEDDA